uniref:Uncharacterized protein n=1 Tax=Arundo donax TaxID=35708 RepID=A0A0A9AAX9_ARUDO
MFHLLGQLYSYIKHMILPAISNKIFV